MDDKTLNLCRQIEGWRRWGKKRPLRAGGRPAKTSTGA
jgi:hypothetical protein